MRSAQTAPTAPPGRGKKQLNISSLFLARISTRGQLKVFWNLLKSDKGMHCSAAVISTPLTVETTACYPNTICKITQVQMLGLTISSFPKSHEILQVHGGAKEMPARDAVSIAGCRMV